MSEKKKAYIQTKIPKTMANNLNNPVRNTKIVAVATEFMPTYESKGAACCDLRANIMYNGEPSEKVIYPQETVLIDVGIKIQLPPGFEAQIRAKSGWGKKGLIVSNGIGTIDEDYRGPIMVPLTNTTEYEITVYHLNKIAQMCLKPVYYFNFEVVDTLDTTERGEGGFGSTGV